MNRVNGEKADLLAAVFVGTGDRSEEVSGQMKVVVRAGIACALLGLAFFALGSGALATTGQDGPTPPKVGDPVGSNVSPHGGYSSTSNFCLQCHQIHDAAGAYALLWKSSVTSTCRTCHGYMGTAPTGTRNPIGPGTIGTASVRTVYDVTAPGSEHGIGAANPPGDSGIEITQADWSYGWRFGGGPPPVDATTPAGPGTASATGGGLYCASCHTPHGEYGQAINTKKVWSTDSTGDIYTQTLKDWAEGTQIWWRNPTTGSWAYRYLHQDADPAGVWEMCDSATPAAVPGGPDSGCAYAQVKDSEGQLVYMFGYKLLSAYPNHTYAEVKSWGADKYDHDQPKWCGSCHPSRLDEEFGGATHNHPTGCGACHGNPADASSADYPHTSTKGGLLKALPDALCVTCHTAGSLP